MDFEVIWFEMKIFNGIGYLIRKLFKCYYTYFDEYC